MTILGLIFITSSEKPFKEILQHSPFGIVVLFHTCTFNTFNIISGEIPVYTPLPHVIYYQFGFANLSINFVALKKLGSKAIIMFLAGTLGIILGGPLYIYCG
jgi:uncharacterized membrane protein